MFLKSGDLLRKHQWGDDFGVISILQRKLNSPNALLSVKFQRLPVSKFLDKIFFHLSQSFLNGLISYSSDIPQCVHSADKTSCFISSWLLHTSWQCALPSPGHITLCLSIMNFGNKLIELIVNEKLWLNW